MLLHEGLGSVSAWREFPADLAVRTGRTVIVYSRYGYGRSEPLHAPRDVGYLHQEGEVVLPALLDVLGISAPVLFGHSDGASIALIFAGSHPHAVPALILESPHIFVERLQLEGIARTKDTAGASGLIEKLARHHDDPSAMFRGWYEIWLQPSFLTWNITEYLSTITAPLLLLQGRDDEYGGLEQIAAIAQAVPQAETLVLEHSGHSPHRTQKETVLARTAAFLAQIE